MTGLIQNPRIYSTLQVGLVERQDRDELVQECIYDKAVEYAEPINQWLKKYAIHGTIGMKIYFSMVDRENAGILQKVKSTVTTVAPVGESLYAVTELDMSADLTKGEYTAFTDYLTHQFRHGWGADLECETIPVDGTVGVCVRLGCDEVSFYPSQYFERMQAAPPQVSDMVIRDRLKFIHQLGLMEEEHGISEDLRLTDYGHGCYLPKPGVSHEELERRHGLLCERESERQELRENVKERIEEEYKKEHYDRWMRLSPEELVARAQDIAGINAAYELADGMTNDGLRDVARYKNPLQFIADFCAEWNHNENIWSLENPFQHFLKSGSNRELEEAFRERDWETIDSPTPEQTL